MTLEQIASIAEILGLILVIASMIYLARQIRQTTAMMRVGASNERIQRDTGITCSVCTSKTWFQMQTGTN
jgi:hypothetical protein